MSEELKARRIFKEQIERELLDKLRTYQVGFVSDEGLTMRQDTSLLFASRIFAIPPEQYEAWFNGQ